MKITRWPALLALAAAAAMLVHAPARAQKSGRGDLGGKPSTFHGTGADFSGRGSMPPSSGTYELSVVDEIPELLNRDVVERAMSDAYPDEMRQQGITGTVILRFVIRPDGTVDPLSIAVQSATHAAFVQPASTVVMQMRFKPAKVVGTPVRAWVLLPIVFQLETPTPPPAAPPGR